MNPALLSHYSAPAGTYSAALFKADGERRCGAESLSGCAQQEAPSPTLAPRPATLRRFLCRLLGHRWLPLRLFQFPGEPAMRTRVCTRCHAHGAQILR